MIVSVCQRGCCANCPSEKFNNCFDFRISGAFVVVVVVLYILLLLGCFVVTGVVLFVLWRLLLLMLFQGLRLHGMLIF